MINLSLKSGLDIFLKENGKLEFKEDLLKIKPQARKFSEAKNYFKNKKAKFNNGNILYYMYRGVCENKDIEFFKKKNWRYDITVIFPGNVGEEFNKTIGHFHKFIEGKKISYPEIYQVILGEAIFLIQKINFKNKNVEKVWIIKAKEGDKIVIPSQKNFLFGHTTINVGKNFLVLANLQNQLTKSDYSFYQEKQGAVYYIVKSKNKEKYLFVPNPQYFQHPTPEIYEGTKTFGFFKPNNLPLYKEVIFSPNKFSFLKN
jgi:glucose-6-phosphate isomerase, archaeal